MASYEQPLSNAPAPSQQPTSIPTAHAFMHRLVALHLFVFPDLPPASLPYVTSPQSFRRIAPLALPQPNVAYPPANVMYPGDSSHSMGTPIAAPPSKLIGQQCR